jgi:hypothetical protein
MMDYFEFKFKKTRFLSDMNLNINNLKNLPIQCIIEYKDKNNGKYMKVFTDLKSISSNKEEILKRANLKIVSGNAIQKSAKMAMEGNYRKAQINIMAWKNRVYNLEKIFTENGVPTNYVKFYYPDDNILLSTFDDRQTRMYLGAEVQYFRDLDLKCEESSTNNEVILYAVWRDKDGKTSDPVTDNEPKTDGKKNNGNKDDEDYDYEEELELDGSSMLNLSILLFISLLLY